MGKETETKLRKNLAQLRMARYTLIGMGVFTVALFFVPIERVNALSDVSNFKTDYNSQESGSAMAANQIADNNKRNN